MGLLLQLRDALQERLGTSSVERPLPLQARVDLLELADGGAQSLNLQQAAVLFLHLHQGVLHLVGRLVAGLLKGLDAHHHAVLDRLARLQLDAELVDHHPHGRRLLGGGLRLLDALVGRLAEHALEPVQPPLHGGLALLRRAPVGSEVAAHGLAVVLLHPALLAEAALELADPAAGLDELLSVLLVALALLQSQGFQSLAHVGHGLIRPRDLAVRTQVGRPELLDVLRELVVNSLRVLHVLVVLVRPTLHGHLHLPLQLLQPLRDGLAVLAVPIQLPRRRAELLVARLELLGELGVGVPEDRQLLGVPVRLAGQHPLDRVEALARRLLEVLQALAGAVGHRGLLLPELLHGTLQRLHVDLERHHGGPRLGDYLVDPVPDGLQLPGPLGGQVFEEAVEGREPLHERRDRLVCLVLHGVMLLLEQLVGALPGRPEDPLLDVGALVPQRALALHHGVQLLRQVLQGLAVLLDVQLVLGRALLDLAEALVEGVVQLAHLRVRVVEVLHALAQLQRVRARVLDELVLDRGHLLLQRAVVDQELRHLRLDGVVALLQVVEVLRGGL
mmetsp:Transcript_25956/g.57213  ORF Transcript_25956/g.57213 Transcript_25956/m.57213 type:complete len:560 (-) Transcript_25956:1810-3489(-)